MSFRIMRFSSTLKHTIADIMLNEVNDPCLKSVIIKDIQLSNDLRNARIIVGSATNRSDELILRLNRAKGFLKRNLAKRMYLKYVPDLIFIGEKNNKIK